MNIRIFLTLFLCAGSAFAAGRQLTGVYAPAATAPLPPEEAAKKMVLPDGFEARIFAYEPQVVNPVGMTWDERGRLWVVELYEYPLGAAPGTKPRDNIKILEDTDNDGKADKVTVFADGLNLATGVLVGYGGVFVGQAPHLLFLEDTDGDDKADKQTIVKTGFGLEDRHELLNGFTWGPDGQLYMTHGIFTHSKVRNPDDPEDDGVTMTAAVARYHPLTRKFEVVAEGTSNPWGVDFDRAGNAFVSACVIEHLFHMAPGGLYQRQAGTPPYPYAYELLPAINDHKHFRAAYAGIQVYQGDQYPAEYRGTILMGNIHDNSIHQDRLTPDGSSFKASFVKDFVRANDGWFRPVSMQVGPDGAVWVMDWYDKYPCYQNANADPEGVDRAHGRIWRIVYTGGEKGKAVPSRSAADLDLGKASVEELVATLGHANVWHRRMAQRILSERRDGDSRGPLLRLMRESRDSDARIAAFWTLQSSGLLTMNYIEQAAGDPDPVLRLWAARFVGERAESSTRSVEILSRLGRDSEPSVRLAVATAARQFVSGELTVNTPPREMPPDGLGGVLANIFLHEQSGTDPVIPFLMWTALEPLAIEQSREILEWFAQNGMQNPPLASKLLRKVMRRFCDDGAPGLITEAVEFLRMVPADAAPLLIGALDGLIEGQKGRAFLPDQRGATTLASLRAHSSSEVASRAQQLGAIWGDVAALAASLRTLSDASNPADERIRAIQSLRQHRTPAVRDALAGIVRDGDSSAVVDAAIAGLAEFPADDTADILLDAWKQISPANRRTAADVLSSRGRWAQRLISAVEGKSIAIGEIPAPVIRNLTTSQDEQVRARSIQVIGRYRESTDDKAKLIAEKKQAVLSGPVDLRKGLEVAQRTCLTCHKLHGEGTDVGPDITGVGRSSLDALLANIIDPNQLIGAGYENVEVTTRDDRTIAGRLVENTDSRVTIKLLGGNDETIAKSEIEHYRVSELSVMPEGLEQMSDEDFRNMIWYILNPPQDDKPLFILPGDKQLVVKSKNASGELVDLVTYVADPEVRPYLHPVKDPSGKTTLTQDRPSDHPWQHGIFTGLHKVNGIDFWSEREGKQRFVRFLDVIQEQDHVGWRVLAEWVSPEGEVVVEEEQFIKVNAPVSPASYDIDFDWTLRAPDKQVKIGRHDYGGFAIRMEYAPEHTHLNSNGERNKATANKRAAWSNVARSFDGETFGIVVYDHPGNAGHPARWRVDAQGLINPSPSLQGDWSIAAGREQTFHYRLSVFQGAGEPEPFERAFKSFSAIRFDQFASLERDGESIALWNPEWRLDLPDFEGTPLKLPDYAGKKNVLMTHPYSREKAARIERLIEVPKDQRTVLTFNVAAHEQGDWELRVFVNDQLLKKQVVDKEGERWKAILVDLTPYAGKKVNVRLDNAANNWSWEFGYWNDIRVSSL